MNLLNDLKERGLVAQMTDEAKITELLAGNASMYCGFDPTADSLHVGSLLPLITMLRFKRAGHTVHALIGGATGMIGDPSFKSSERVLQNADTIDTFKKGITAQIKSILGDVSVVDNHDWTANLSVIDFLRDVGKHFSVNAMMNKDSVKTRLTRDDQGISFTEFSYQLLQSMDFHHLWKHMDCKLQLGGSDQWGNITAGIDLIHKREGNSAVATGLTSPLLVKSDGTKFGKSESGAVWLSADKTKPFDFFQFWLKVSDADVAKFFKMLSLKSIAEIDAILLADKDLVKPMAQRRLAEELTELVHGHDALASVLQQVDALFTGGPPNIDALIANGMRVVSCEAGSLVDILVITGLAKSKREAREFLINNAVSVNGVKSQDHTITKTSVLQRGKREFVIAEIK